MELREVRWERQNLFCAGEIVANDPYRITIYEPEGYLFSGVDTRNAEVVSNIKQGPVRILTLQSPVSALVEWTLYYD